MDHIDNYTAQIRDYFRSGQLQPVHKNSSIISSGDDPHHFYYIASGYVRVYSTNTRNEQYTHIIYGPGEVMPLIWLIKQQRINTIFEALTDCQLRSMPLRNFMVDLRSNPTVAYAMMQQAIEQYRIYSLRVDNLEYKYASERLAYSLILLANRFGERSGDSLTIVPLMTHQLLGSTLNLSRESVSREMEKLLRRGLVRYNGSRQIVIPKIQELANQLHVPLSQGLSENVDAVD